jgi:hypothetical protein
MSGLVVWGGYTWIQKEYYSETTPARRQPTVMRVALVAAIFAGGAHAMVSGVIVAPVSQVLLAVFVGWAWGRCGTQYKTRSSLRVGLPSMWARSLLYVLLVAAIGVLGTRVQDLRVMAERRTAFLQAVERNVLSPRYWQQGFIAVRDPGVIERVVMPSEHLTLYNSENR